jgi:hypothetical protein
MPIPENDHLGHDFEKRLSAALDGVKPPSPAVSSARYRSAHAWRPGRRWRLAPALAIGIGAAGMALSAVAATGSPNPVVWTEHAGAVIESVGHHSSAGPKATQSPRDDSDHGTPRSQGDGHQGSQTTPSSGQDNKESPEPTERPEASPSPEQSPSPEATPEPTPSQDSSHGGDSTPSPSPDGDGDDH